MNPDSQKEASITLNDFLSIIAEVMSRTKLNPANLSESDRILWEDEIQRALEKFVTKWKIGAQVQLQSGGPTMTVIGVDKSGSVRVTWMLDGEKEPQYAEFPPDALKSPSNLSGFLIGGKKHRTDDD